MFDMAWQGKAKSEKTWQCNAKQKKVLTFSKLDIKARQGKVI